MAQKARLVGVQLGQSQPQPVELLRHAPDVGRTADVDNFLELVLAQRDDRVLKPLERSGQPDAEAQRQHDRKGDGRHHLLSQQATAVVELGQQFLVAPGDALLHVLRDGGVQRIELAELKCDLALAVERSLGRAAQKARNRCELAAPVLGRERGQLVVLQPVDDAACLARRVVVAAAQLRIGQHQRLACGAFHRQTAFVERLCRGRKADRARRAVAALSHQVFEREERPQRRAAQQRGDQQKGDQQPLPEGNAVQLHRREFRFSRPVTPALLLAPQSRRAACARAIR